MQMPWNRHFGPEEFDACWLKLLADEVAFFFVFLHDLDDVIVDSFEEAVVISMSLGKNICDRECVMFV